MERWCKWIDHLNGTHHTSILMWKDVAMINESSNEILKLHTDYHFPIRRKDHCVLQAMCLIRWTIHRHYLEVIDVDVKCMIIVIDIFNLPFL
jgi:hypothetical protein